MGQGCLRIQLAPSLAEKQADKRSGCRGPPRLEHTLQHMTNLVEVGGRRVVPLIILPRPLLQGVVVPILEAETVGHRGRCAPAILQVDEHAVLVVQPHEVGQAQVRVHDADSMEDVDRLDAGPGDPSSVLWMRQATTEEQGSACKAGDENAKGLGGPVTYMQDVS